MDWENLLRTAVNERKKQLIRRLLASGKYDGQAEELSSWTLSELEDAWAHLGPTAHDQMGS